jgi:protein-S-isoprenylcysteine O-methyltransferase Ste14
VGGKLPKEAGTGMNTLRYDIALGLVVALPAALPLWLLIHPFIRFWRRLGPVWTYGLIWALIIVIGREIFRARGVLLSVDFGASYPLVVLGLLLVAVSSWYGMMIWRHFPTGTILGLPELAPEKYGTRLVTSGPFAVIRNPRYVQFYLGVLGLACIANYLAAYVAVALWLPGIYVIVLLEEKELRQRFGQEYEEYCRQVPRFIPKFK